MFNKILVALDTSTSARSVFEEALALAKAFQANLTLLHVLFKGEEGSPDISLISSSEYYLGLGMSTEILEIQQKRWEDFVNRKAEMLRNLAEEAIAAGVTAEFSQNPGIPGHTICEFARNGKFNLIVLGRKGRSGLPELLLGSVSNYVMHHAPCSVLTVQHPVIPDETENARAEEGSLFLSH
jgi:nucleotide-binding universal stress UspA family protein